MDGMYLSHRYVARGWLSTRLNTNLREVGARQAYELVMREDGRRTACRLLSHAVLAVFVL